MKQSRPNILFIMSDDHAAHAMSCYGSRVNRTPNLDRIAEGGMRFDNCFCTNSICTPSRAAILAGTYNHTNGVTTLTTPMDNRLTTFPKLLQADGYQAAIFGKWHLGTGPEHCPTGFDDWAVVPGQGKYHNPEFLFKGPDGGTRRTVPGYVTDLIADNTLVIYTSDQGFFLGDHGWYDKRFMYEESLRMPFVARYPREIAPGSVNGDIVLNVDFAPLFLDLAGLPVPVEFQGRSFRSLLRGQTPDDWQQALYYRYWMHKAHHNVYAHYGIRTKRHKLIYYYADALSQPGAVDTTHPPEWELFDLERDPHELHNVYADPAYAGRVVELKRELHRLQAQVGDTRYPQDVD